MSQPRSIRLNQAHRADIVDAVMAQWEVNNPEPTEYTYENMVLDLLVQTKKVKRKSAIQKRNAEIIKNSEALANAVKDLPEIVTNHVKIQLHHTLNVITVSSDGTESMIGHVRLPLQVMQDNGFNLLSRDSMRAYQLEGFDNLNEDDRGLIPIAGFAGDDSGRISIRIERDSPFYLKYRENTKERSDWRKERNRNRSEIIDYLNQFNTTKQIRDGWPELVDYLPPHLADPEAVIKLPALAVSRLNERLGLK